MVRRHVALFLGSIEYALVHIHFVRKHGAYVLERLVLIARFCRGIRRCGEQGDDQLCFRLHSKEP